MGRKSLPTALKVLAGNPGKRALNHDEPQLATGIGEPPAWLDEEGRAEWWRIVPDLEEAGVTTRVEATMLATYCQAVSRMIASEAIIAREGLVTIGQRGPMKHPAVTIARESALVIAKIGSEFGITPSSRSKIKAAPKQQGNPFADLDDEEPAAAHST